MKNLSGATTRTRRVLLPIQRAEHLLAPEQVISSPETQLRYRIERLIGQGGFGQVFLATRQLLGMLVRGDAKSRVRTPDVRRLRCSDELKEIIYRCIGERRKRYETADQLIEALRNPPATLKAGALKTLKGVHLAFTGILSQPRKDAIRGARRAGAVVHGMPSARTSVVVRGRPNKLQAAGKDAGLKLMEIKRLRAKGQKITLLNETQFWRLVGGRRTLASAKKK